MMLKVCRGALLLRILLVVWGHLQDMYSAVKYTDVDYFVFTDAARYVSEGQSPYLRPTYRYTPLLAWILIPNIKLNIMFGKLLFSTIDIVNGIFIYDNVQCRFGEDAAIKSLVLWLFNPITLVVSTRGNAETLITLCVLLTVHYHRKSSYFISGLLHGLAVHLKLYPIIYSVVLYTSISNCSTLFKSLKPTTDRMKFVVGFLSSFAVLTCVSYLYYGWPFVHETFLYHVTRKDVRHNFSPYFYLLYLYSSTESSLVSISCFAPQLLIVLMLSWRYRSKKDVSLALFMLTYGFVTFNKVVTSQYFLWYLSLLPLCLPQLQFGRRKSIILTTAWLAAQAVWLFFAYLLEFRGANVFVHVWLASLLFFSVNIWIMSQCLRARHQKPPTKSR